MYIAEHIDYFNEAQSRLLTFHFAQSSFCRDFFLLSKNKLLVLWYYSVFLVEGEKLVLGFVP